MTDVVKANFSSNYNAVQARIRRLPRIVDDMASATMKKDALAFIKMFQEGIKNKSFKLQSLHPFSKQRKSELGMSQPSTPLYGAGEDEKNAYVNTLRIRKVKNGWKVFRSNARHHDSDLSLKALMAIHENGAVINVTPKMGAFLHFMGLHLRADTKVIRVPPRPTYQKAFNRMLREKSRRENIAEVKKAINIYVKTGNISAVDKYRSILKGKDFET